MNRKKIFSLLSICFFIMTAPAYIYGDSDLRTFSAEVIFSTFTPCQISHTAITSVSAVDRILNAKVKVNFGSFISATAEMLYHTGSNTDVTVSKGAINHMSEFYIATPKLESSESVDYQIKITLKNKDNATEYAYWPSSSTYQHAVIISSVSAVVSSTGTTVTLGTGNQEHEDTNIIIPPGTTIPLGTEITITQLDITGPSPVAASVMRKAPSTLIMVAKYSVTPLEQDINPAALATFSYGTETTATHFVLMRSSNLDMSAPEEVTIIETGLSGKVVKANITKGGYYAVYEKTSVADNDYRPSKRAITKKGIAERGKNFEFNNLVEGDVVKIFNINGKKIRTISTGDAGGFIWNGRKDNGDWAESGTYIYQIKLKEESKTISGTIAFVK